MKIRHVLHFAAVMVSLALPLAAGSLTTTFAGGNRFTGNMFDASVGSNALTVTGLAVNVDSGPLTIDVYVKTGTYVGFDTNTAAWTLVSATAVTGLGSGSATNVAVTPFVLAANTVYGIYVTIDTNANAAPFMYYTNGNASYSNSDLSLSLGEGLGGKFGSLTLTPGRTWNGTINYTVATTTLPEPATWGLLALAGPAMYVARRRYLRKY